MPVTRGKRRLVEHDERVVDSGEEVLGHEGHEPSKDGGVGVLLGASILPRRGREREESLPVLPEIDPKSAGNETIFLPAVDARRRGEPLFG